MAQPFMMQNQLKFNLDIALAASNVAVRYHKPAPIVVERAGGIVNIPHSTSNEALQKEHSSRSSVADDRMALAVQLAKRDLKKQREGAPPRSRESSPKAMKSHISKGGTKMLYTRQAKERSQRFQDKQSQNKYLKIREQGWNVGIPAAPPQTPPKNKTIKSNLPASTNSPPTKDVGHYPDQKCIPNNSPDQEINRMQKEMEHYLQQIQVIEQKAMKEHSNLDLQPLKTRRKDGYLDEDEDPTRVALRHEEQATRSARQLYFLRQQVRSLQEHVTRGGKGRVKHTRKSQIMLRLAAAHRGAVRAIQSFVNHQLPQQDLKRGLPMGYHELALLIRQLALLSTQIQTNQDTAPVHKDLINMLDRVEELNQAWCEESVHQGEEEVPERRRKSPQGQQQVIPTQEMKSRQSAFQHRRVGKENRPKGLLKKQMHKAFIAGTSSKPRKLTPERHQILQAGLKTFIHENMQVKRDDSQSRQPSAGMTWTIPANENTILEPSNSSLILPKGLQYKREKAQRSVALAVPDTHFSHPTMSYNQKVVQPSSTNLSSREPWKPSGSVNKSPNQGQSHDRSRSCERRPSSIDGSLSQSPKHTHRNFVVQDVDQELMQELFPGDGVNGERRRGRSLSPVLGLGRQRSLSPPRSPESRSRFAAHRLQKRLGQLQKNTEDMRMARKCQYELSEINMRQLLADKMLNKAHLSGETITDMILNDVLRDTAEELQSLENEDVIRQEATTLHHNPTLENIYQRLEQMELEQLDIRRRWGTLHFEEASCSNYNFIPIQQPCGPVAMEITRHGPTQPHRVQNSRMCNSDTDVPVAPVIFTKSVPVQVFKQKTARTEEMAERPIFSYRTKLKISESTVKEICSNLEKYEHHLKSTSHHLQGTFDPTKLMEEISDNIFEDCLKEIEAELEDIGENIVHQVCKSEFAIPESTAVLQSPTQDQEIENVASENFRYTKMVGKIIVNPGHVERKVQEVLLRNTSPSSRDNDDERLRSSGEISEILRSSAEKSALIRSSAERTESVRSSAESVRSSAERYVHHVNSDRSAQEAKSLKKSVSFIKNNSYDEEIGFQNEAIFDAADLDTAMVEPDAEQNDLYEDDYEDDDSEEDNDFDVENISPIDSDALEYSTDET